jgi:hypothetical protein
MNKAELAKVMFSEVEPESKSKETPQEEELNKITLSTDDLKIIVEQTGCSEEDAKIYFEKNNGDLENTIIDYLESTNVLQKPKELEFVSDDNLLNDNISTLDKMATYRDILYKKDLIFQSKFNEGMDVSVIELKYVAFKQDTKEYRKLTFKGNKDDFITEVIQPYINNKVVSTESSESTENTEEAPKEEGNPDYKIIIKTILREGLNIAKKWGFTKPVLIYNPNSTEIINELATKFMYRSGHFAIGEVIKGPAILVDNWIM